MTIKTFWTIFFKILGLWLIVGSLAILHQALSTLLIIHRHGNDILLTLISIVGLMLLFIGMYIFILRLFVFRTAWLINILHLDKGFEEEKIDLNIQLASVLKIATIVIGGLMFIDGLPELCRHIFIFLQQKNVFRESPASVWIIFYLSKVIIGYLLMTNSKLVVKFIERKTIEKTDNDI